MNYNQFQGLSWEEVAQSRALYGSNSIHEKRIPKFLLIVFDTVKEPMFLILVTTSALYFVLGEVSEGLTMLVALGIVSGISIFQENRTQSAEEALKQYYAPQCKVIREGKTQHEAIANLVVGDFIILEKGDLIPADGEVVEAHDFSVQEGIVTGESMAVYKNIQGLEVFHGTQVEGGASLVKITKVGTATYLNSLGKTISDIEELKSPLQLSLNAFVKKMVGFGAVAFLLVWAIQYIKSGSLVFGLLKGLTLAMSVIPEELPVAFSTFMALGAYKLYKLKVLVKTPFAVEALGSATVICADKTGTLTENRMELAAVYIQKSDQLIWQKDEFTHAIEVITYGMWASEPEPFDGMEKSLHAAYERLSLQDDRPNFHIIHEYPLEGSPPIMTHIHYSESTQAFNIAVKGGLETLLPLCQLSKEQNKTILEESYTLNNQGYRIIGVGRIKERYEIWPEEQTGFLFEFLGFLAFYDPPKPQISETILALNKAGIGLKMITGDYEKTALSIANQCGIKTDDSLTGNQIMKLTDEELRIKVNNTAVFARMFPQAKLRVIEALKANGEVVAMTGDGVNDGPALKAAHIGIAMGKKGSELAKKASSLILLDDDLTHIYQAVETGRAIYNNLKKAIIYIISIHIPIILIVTLPLIFSWTFSNIFNPIHVIFLELIMGPTCSIVFENEPIETNLMNKKPRQANASFLNQKEMMFALVNGMAITICCLLFAYLSVEKMEYSEEQARAGVFSTLIFCNIFLTLSSRSQEKSMFATLHFKNWLVPFVLIAAIFLLAITVYFKPAQELFYFKEITFVTLLITLGLSLFTVLLTDFFKKLIFKPGFESGILNQD